MDLCTDLIHQRLCRSYIYQNSSVVFLQHFRHSIEADEGLSRTGWGYDEDAMVLVKLIEDILLPFVRLKAHTVVGFCASLAIHKWSTMKQLKGLKVKWLTQLAWFNATDIELKTQLPTRKRGRPRWCIMDA
jgi:hypothetical protein